MRVRSAYVSPFSVAAAIDNYQFAFEVGGAWSSRAAWKTLYSHGPTNCIGDREGDKAFF